MAEDHIQQLASLFKTTSVAHHDAFLESHGDDPEWPLWYANMMMEPINQILPGSITKSKLVYELIWLAENAQTDGREWVEVYAEELMKKYA